MKRWLHYNPVKVHFGPGLLADIGQHAHYERATLITSPGFSARGTVDQVALGLGPKLVLILDDVSPNPDIDKLDSQLDLLRSASPDVLIALGGGSSIDTAKALARAATQPGMTLAGHFRSNEVFSEHSALPIIAVPTTAGTGAEVTPFGTVWDFSRGKKYSVLGDDLYPKTALLDPELTYHLPWEITVSSGFDAISHALESIWNHNATPTTQALATKSLELAIPALRRLVPHPDDKEARAAMMQASLLAGMAISQTRTALAHSISYPLTTTFGLPHGIACSFTLPALSLYNARCDDGRLTALTRTLGYADMERFAADLLALLRECGAFAILERHIPETDKILELVSKMITPERAGNNLRHADAGNIEQLLRDTLATLGDSTPT